jgi:hypothetical protein
MPLKALYELDRESARELANKTVHTVMHLGWVQGPTVITSCGWPFLVKPNGRFGRRSMAAIAPSGTSSSTRPSPADGNEPGATTPRHNAKRERPQISKPAP